VQLAARPPPSPRRLVARQPRFRQWHAIPGSPSPNGELPGQPFGA